jgi:hypothetical protein
MDVRSKLAILWIALGLFEIIVAYLFILKKQDLFADPNAWLAARWIKAVKKTQELADVAMDSGIVNRAWLVGLTVKLMTRMGLCQILLGGFLFVRSWTTTTAIVISAVSFAAMLACSISVFTMKCIEWSKKR